MVTWNESQKVTHKGAVGKGMFMTQVNHVKEKHHASIKKVIASDSNPNDESKTPHTLHKSATLRDTHTGFSQKIMRHFVLLGPWEFNGPEDWWDLEGWIFLQ